MVLDQVTLSLLVVLNSVLFALVWGVSALRFPQHISVRYWFFASVMTGAGALGLLSDLTHNNLHIVWQSCLVAGLSLFAMGARVFHQARAGLGPAAALIVMTVTGLVLLRESPVLSGVFADICRALPLIAGALFLLTHARRGSGAGVAVGGLLLALVGHGLEILATLDPAGAPAAAYALLAIIYGGTMWSFGFGIMVAERLFGQVTELATTDPLTGVANRRLFETRLARELRRAERTGGACAMLMIDIDEFKQLNDRYGHAWGDRCLKHLADCIGSDRSVDEVVARLGGDEFAVLMPGASPAHAADAARRIRQSVLHSPVIWRGRRASFTISVGAAAWQSGMDAEDLTMAADMALYGAKASNRAHAAKAASSSGEDAGGARQRAPGQVQSGGGPAA